MRVQLVPVLQIKHKRNENILNLLKISFSFYTGNYVKQLTSKASYLFWKINFLLLHFEYFIWIHAFREVINILFNNFDWEAGKKYYFGGFSIILYQFPDFIGLNQ